MESGLTVNDMPQHAFASAESTASANVVSEGTVLVQFLGTWITRLAVVDVIVTAVDLRPVVTSVGQILEELRRGHMPRAPATA
jgi:hypothetical protein